MKLISCVTVVCLLVSTVSLVSATQGKAKKWQVVAVVSSPFLEAANEKGKNSGLIIDILEAMKKENSSFDYLLKEQKDGVYGDVYANGTTTGVINAVVSGAFDFAAGDLTIKKSRFAVVGWSVPYYQSQYRPLVNNHYDPASVSYFTYDIASVQNLLAKYVNPNANVGDSAGQAAVGVAKIAKGARSANASTAVVRTLDPKGPAANLTDAVQRLLNSKSSLALIGETPSIILQYHAHKDQLKLLPDVLASSYYGFAVKFGNLELRLILNELILALGENGTLQKLTDKYIPSGCQ